MNALMNHAVKEHYRLKAYIPSSRMLMLLLREDCANVQISRAVVMCRIPTPRSVSQLLILYLIVLGVSRLVPMLDGAAS